MTEFGAVFQENKEFIFKYLIRLTGDISLAEELFAQQELVRNALVCLQGAA